MGRKTKVLYISSVVPSTSCGASLAIYRHFVAKDDFEIAVACINADLAMVDKKMDIRTSRYFVYIKKLGFERLFANLEYIINWISFPPGLVRFVKEYKPDVIMTVPDLSHTGYAYMLSRKLAVPLAVDYQDLTPLSRFISGPIAPYRWVRKYLMRKYHFLHKECDLAFYTSEGMQKYFGEHKNGHVLYPLGDFNRPEINTAISKPNHPIRIIYAGNCYGAYGRMLLRFAKAVKNSPEINFKIFPVGKGWTDEDIREMTEAGIYQSFMPFEQLKKEFASADAFLTVMSFECPEEPFVRTSFTTKWLDYAPYGKPIFVWGPDYASANIFAEKHDCGIIVNQDDAEKLKEAITNLAENPEKWTHFGRQARKVSENALNAEKIHNIFKTEINRIAGH